MLLHHIPTTVRYRGYTLHLPTRSNVDTVLSLGVMLADLVLLVGTVDVVFGAVDM